MMSETFLYQQIVAEIRKEILEGRLKPGDRLATVRQMTGRWNCTIGTVQRAYQELARQGLVVSRAGQGTHVAGAPPAEEEVALRRAQLVHRAEAFLLDMLTAGFGPQEVDAALHQAMERWQVLAQAPQPGEPLSLRCAGSHDPALAWLAAHFVEIAPPYRLNLEITGSLGGLIALAERRADLAGCHLWDEQSGAYNEPFVRRLLPGRRVALVTLAHRRLGLITAPGNPFHLAGLASLAQPGLVFANRQAGSGTRVWLDAALRREGLPAAGICGYDQEYRTHFEVAAAVAAGQAGAGFGLEAAARSYALDFIYLLRERYELALPGEVLALPPAQRLVEWLSGPAARQLLADFGGYETEESGSLRWV